MSVTLTKENGKTWKGKKWKRLVEAGKREQKQANAMQVLVLVKKDC